jgi:hypothetical protein
VKVLAAGDRLKVLMRVWGRRPADRRKLDCAAIPPFLRQETKCQFPPCLFSDNPSDVPRQEHQVGRFLSIFEERLARRA